MFHTESNYLKLDRNISQFFKNLFFILEILLLYCNLSKDKLRY